MLQKHGGRNLFSTSMIILTDEANLWSLDCNFSVILPLDKHELECISSARLFALNNYIADVVEEIIPGRCYLLSINGRQIP